MIDCEAVVEHWLERSSIMEFDGQIERKRAEVLAMHDTVKRFGKGARECIKAHTDANNKRDEA